MVESSAHNGLTEVRFLQGPSFRGFNYVKSYVKFSRSSGYNWLDYNNVYYFIDCWITCYA